MALSPRNTHTPSLMMDDNRKVGDISLHLRSILLRYMVRIIAGPGAVSMTVGARLYGTEASGKGFPCCHTIRVCFEFFS